MTPTICAFHLGFSLDSYRPTVRWRTSGAYCQDLYSSIFDLHIRAKTARQLYLEEREERVPKASPGELGQAEFDGFIESLEMEAEITLGKTATKPYLTCLKGTGSNG